MVTAGRAIVATLVAIAGTTLALAQDYVTFSDRREVGGLLLPYHIVTEGRGAIREDLRLYEIKVNPEIGRADFKE